MKKPLTIVLIGIFIFISFETKAQCTAEFATVRSKCLAEVEFEATLKDSSKVYSWRFGDGNVVEGKALWSVKHDFNLQDSGVTESFLNRLWVGDGAKWCAQDSQVVTIEAYIKDITFGAHNRGDTLVEFSIELRDPTVMLSKSVFYFGNGDSITDLKHLWKYTYADWGRYEACMQLTVSNSGNNGCEQTWCDSVLVNSACAPSFDVTSDTNQKFTIFLVNTTPKKAGQSFVWDFGDRQGTPKAGRTPQYKYDRFGKFEVCCYMIDSLNDCQGYVCDSIGMDSTGKLLKANGFQVVVLEEEDVSLERIQAQRVTLFPNPVTDLLRLDGVVNGEFEIYNSRGNLVQANAFEHSTIDVHDYVSGVYVLLVHDNENRLLSATFVKE